ncbi:VanW family protein [Rubrobacter indicoceani]|uniref:VanW family protein n=1 Tax=Rubrobacter indicoceani TaxID=2051957 RepID=UPI0013C401E5|nr:VanW family protein [Rubrobacter indicoceani]
MQNATPEGFLVRRGSGEKRASRKAPTGARRVYGVVLAVCALLAVLVAMDAWANSGKVYRGVEVGSLALGGKTPEEASGALRDRSEGLREVRLSGAGDASLAAREIGLRLNTAETVRRAYAVGREGSIPARLGERVRALFGSVAVEPAVDYRPEEIREGVRTLAGELDSEPRNASVGISGDAVEVERAAAGFEVDVAATERNIRAAVENLEGEAPLAGGRVAPAVATGSAEAAAQKARAALSGPVTLVLEEEEWMLSRAEIGHVLEVFQGGDGLDVRLDGDHLRESLPGMYESLTTEPVEAGFRVFGTEVSVTESRAGTRIAEEKLYSALERGLFEGKREYRVPVVTTEPRMTTAEAERLKPTTRLSRYRTDYTWDTDPGRRTNMEIASNAMSGTLVAPGEVFSYNAVAEPLDYEQAKVIKNGAADYEEGGGLSQVSSTLYMAANLAGLEILEANPHYAELPYIRPGLDTTVWFGALDLRFRNNTGGYVMIQQWQDPDGFNYAEIWGQPTGREVEMRSEKVFDGEDPGGKPTTRWVTYKRITQNGEVLQDGVFRRDTYKELDPYEGPPPNSVSVG